MPHGQGGLSPYEEARPGGRVGPGRAPDIDAINEGDVEERDRALRQTEQRAAHAEGQVARKSFPRLRLNVTAVSPGYVTCSLFQSDNGGTNWGCVGTGINFPEDWFQQTFGGAHLREGAIGLRYEFEVVGTHEVID